MKRKRSITLSRLLTTPCEYWVGCLYYKRDRWARAERWFDAALKRRPAHAESLFQRGMADFKRERWEKAYEHMHAAISLDPGKTNWMVQFCQAARHLGGSNSSAVEICTRHIEQQIAADQNNAHLYSELAKIYRVQGRIWLEIEALRKADSLKPRDASLKVRLGQALEKMKRHAEAAEAYGQAVALDPVNSTCHYKAGFCMEMSRGDGPVDEERMTAYYAKAVANDPTGEAGRYGVGVFHEKGGHWKLAEEAYRARLASHPDDAGLYYKLGMCHDRLYQWEEAGRCYERAVAAEPRNPEWQGRLGFVRERQGRFAEAAEAHRQAVQCGAPGDPDPAYRLAYALDMAGRHEAACKAYAAITPAAAVVQASSRGLRSFVVSRFGKRPAVQRTPEQLAAKLRKDATSAALWFELGRELAQRDDWSGAGAACRQAVDRNPAHHPAHHHLLGTSLMMLGKHADACEAFRNIRILRRNHGSSEVYFQKNEKFRKQASYVEYLETLPLRDKSVLYESFHGRMLSCNPYALFLHMLGSDEYRDWTHIWAVSEAAAVPEQLKGLPNVVFVVRESDVYLRHLATVKLLVNNVSFPSYFIRRDGQLYVNTWHGTPWKTLGTDVKNEFLVHGNVARNLLHCTHIASPNAHTSDVLVNSYSIAGIYKGSIMETGSPRVDLTLNASRDQKQALRKKLGIEDGRKVVLFAPTWRGTLDAPYHEVMETGKIITRLAGLDCHLLFRGHYFVEDALGRGAAAGSVVPASVSTNELLSIVDVLVTDYSSVYFDFMPTGRPIVFHLSDHETYQSERGLYFGTDELPGEVVKDADALCGLLSRLLGDAPPAPHHGYAAALRKFCSAEDGNACRRVLDFVFAEQPQPLPKDGRRTILMFGGHFHLNGITIALINLLNNLDYDKTRLVLAVDTGTVSILPESRSYFESLSDKVQVLPRTGSMNTTPEERLILGDFNRHFHLPESPEVFEVFRRAHMREARRMYGTAEFDATIEFSGYSGFFTALFACAPASMTGFKSIYQHNEMHGEWKTKYPALERVFNLYGGFDHLISVSRSARDLNCGHLAAEFSLPASRFDYAENLVNEADILARAGEPIDAEEDRLLFGSGRKVLLSIGRLSVEKDHQKLIRAFARLCEVRSDVMLVIIGDGPLFATLSMLIGELGLEDRVRLTGYRLNPFPYLRKADCFVFSSNYEGQGLVLLEAMILGKPIVSVDIDVCRGVVENRSGLLVENSVEGLLGGMKAYLDGAVAVNEVDFGQYRRDSLRMFYQKSCGFDGDFGGPPAQSAEPGQGIRKSS